MSSKKTVAGSFVALIYNPFTPTSASAAKAADAENTTKVTIAAMQNNRFILTFFFVMPHP
jgi:hypothetical protein